MKTTNLNKEFSQKLNLDNTSSVSVFSEKDQHTYSVVKYIDFSKTKTNLGKLMINFNDKYSKHIVKRDEFGYLLKINGLKVNVDVFDNSLNLEFVKSTRNTNVDEIASLFRKEFLSFMTVFE